MLQKRKRLFLSLLSFILLVFLCPPLLSAQVPVPFNGGYWEPGFYNTNGVFGGGSLGTPGQVNALVMDGDNHLYAGGFFEFGGSSAANCIARWDGASWSPLDSGLFRVQALAWDEASKTIYAAGNGGLAKWDGVSWTPIPGGPSGPIYSMVWDGANLYVAGTFQVLVEPFGEYGVAKWDGATWTSLPFGEGLDGTVWTLAWDGANLYAGGNFCFAKEGGGLACGLARWDGSAWAPVGSSESGYLPYLSVIYAMAWDNASNSLYAAGSFRAAGDLPVSNIVKWDGATWFPLGAGFDNTVLTLTMDQSSGSLYAGGIFGASGNTPLNRIARWDGASWSSLGSGIQEWATLAFNSVDALLWDNNSKNLYAGGKFPMAGGVPVNGIARWNGHQWFPLGSEAHTVNAPVRTLAWDRINNSIYVGGSFSVSGWVPARNIAKLDGNQWASLGAGMTGTIPQLSSVNSLALDVNNHLYAGGSFIMAGETPANNIARWDGDDWHPLGSGVNGEVLALAWDRGANNLYVGGRFTMAGGKQANNIARWDGDDWHPLGSGVDDKVLALAWDEVSRALYAGGEFVRTGEILSNHIAKWDGTSWSPLRTGVSSRVNALAWDPSKSHLYAGGVFYKVDGLNIRSVAKWDGTHWSGLQSVETDDLREIHGLAWDEGTRTLYAGGLIHKAGGVPANMIAQWDGTRWSPLGAGLLQDIVLTLVWDDVQHILFAGGYFLSAAGNPSYYLARWVQTYSQTYRVFLPLVFAVPYWSEGSGAPPK